MSPFNRRAFLSGFGKAGALLASGPWLSLIGYAQTARGPARLSFDEWNVWYRARA